MWLSSPAGDPTIAVGESHPSRIKHAHDLSLMQRTYRTLVAVTFQVFRLAIVHGHDRSALSEAFAFIMFPAGDGEHCDATIRITSRIWVTMPLALPCEEFC